MRDSIIFALTKLKGGLAGSISTPGVRSKSPPSVPYDHYVAKSTLRYSGDTDPLANRYQQLELKHVFDKGVCGAMEFR